MDLRHPIRLRALGALDIRGGDDEPLRSVLAQPKRAALLIHLALATPRRAHRRDSLLALLWPEQDEEHGRNALNQAVHFLRRALGADVVLSRGSDELELDWSRIWMDVQPFEAACADGRASEAIELYGGDLLDGFHVAGAPEFDQWLEAERARLAALHARALEMVAEQRETAGDFRSAVVHWRKLASRDPLSSRVALRLMRALAAAGDREGALQHARVHELLLREELGVAPDAALVALTERLRAGGGVRDPAPPVEPGKPERAAAMTAIAEPRAASDVTHDSASWSGRRRRMLVAALLVAIVAATAMVIRGGAAEPSREEALRELHQRGRHFELSRSLVDLQTAKESYLQALELDSTYAPAWAGLADVYGMLVAYAYAPAGPMLDSARLAALRAMALDSMLPETRTAYAITLADRRDFAGAEREFRRAIRLDPAFARAHYWYSLLLVALGRGEDALAEANTTLALDRLPPRGALAMQRYATYLVTGDRPWLRMPVTARRPVLQMSPGEPWARAREAAELADVGRCTEARGELEKAQRLTPDGNMRMLPFVGWVALRCGERDRARGVLDSMLRRPDAHDHGYRVAWMYTMLGESDSALVWLERHPWTVSELAGLSADAVLDPLRADPRFHELLRRIGIRP